MCWMDKVISDKCASYMTYLERATVELIYVLLTPIDKELPLTPYLLVS
jgi:hypothetical protein